MQISSKKLIALTAALSIASFGLSATKWQTSLFKKGDVDQDGSLSQAEFLAVKLPLAKKNAAKNNKEFNAEMTEKRMSKAFAKFDTNSDKMLSEDEFYASFPAKKK